MSQETGLYISSPMALKEEWIDYNGHLNMAYYNVLFDQGCDGAFELFGMGPTYTATRKMTVYSAEAHVRYLREIHLGDEVQATFQILDYDEKRLHAFQELRHVDGWVSATSEVLTLHIDQSGPKVSPFPKDIFANIEKMAGEQARLPYPENAGRRIEIVRKKA